METIVRVPGLRQGAILTSWGMALLLFALHLYFGATLSEAAAFAHLAPLTNCQTQLVENNTPSSPIREKVFVLDANIVAGNKIIVPISMDKSFNGVAGYNIGAATQDTSIAHIVQAIPPTPGLTQQNVDNKLRAKIGAVDLFKNIEAGATDIELGAVEIVGVSPGTTTLMLFVWKMDDDDGMHVGPKVFSGQVTVC